MMNAMITGASGGIGYQAALHLAADSGATVVAVSRNEKGLARLVQAAAASRKGRMVTHACDLVTAGEGELKSVLAETGIDHLDVLVNNAGMLLNKPFAELSAADWQAVYATNLFAPAALIRELLPMMGGNRRTHVLNIGSYGGFQGTSKFSGLAAYSSSKAALANLSECLAEEFKDLNISVNCLALGAVNTEMLQKAFPGYTAPLSPGKMGEFVAWFAVHGADFFNGKVLPVALDGV